MVKGRRGGLLHLHLLLTVVEHDLVGLAVLGLGHLHIFIFSFTCRGRGGFVLRLGLLIWGVEVNI